MIIFLLGRMPKDKNDIPLTLGKGGAVQPKTTPHDADTGLNLKSPPEVATAAQQGEGIAVPPYRRHSKDSIYPDNGMYLIKFNGTYLVVIGTSNGNHSMSNYTTPGVFWVC